ncbi:hypothetical protein ACTA71_012439 [Dictyostelium dimigraforme]
MMWGTDIGFRAGDFITSPLFDWQPIIPSYRFESSYTFNTTKWNSVPLVNIAIQLHSNVYVQLDGVVTIVQSIDSVDEKGGNITLYGWFSNSHGSSKVTIDSKDCPAIQNTVINVSVQCTVSPGTGKKPLSIQQNGVSWSGYFIYETGECDCKSGFDCSIIIESNGGIPQSNTTINNNELDVYRNLIQEHSLDNKWTFEMKNSDNNTNNVYQFSQTLVQSITNCTILYTVEEIKEKSKDYSFAGYSSLTLGAGSIKISVSIYNYQFNTDIQNGNNELLNYITIKKDSKIMQARFLNRILSDGRSILSDGRSSIITSEVVSKSSDSIIIGLNLPYCTNSNIDPDFSVLVTSSFKNNCGEGGSSGPAYLIPVVVVSSVIGVALVLTLSYYIFKKKFVENQLSKKLKN